MPRLVNTPSLASGLQWLGDLLVEVSKPRSFNFNIKTQFSTKATKDIFKNLQDALNTFENSPEVFYPTLERIDKDYKNMIRQEWSSKISDEDGSPWAESGDDPNKGYLKWKNTHYPNNRGTLYLTGALYRALTRQKSNIHVKQGREKSITLGIGPTISDIINPYSQEKVSSYAEKLQYGLEGKQQRSFLFPSIERKNKWKKWIINDARNFLKSMLGHY